MESQVGLITAVIVFTTAIVVFFQKLRRDVKEIHVMVNSRMDEALRRIDQLNEALAAAGVDSPAKPGRTYTNGPTRGETG